MRAVFFRNLVRIRRGRESIENKSIPAVVKTAIYLPDRVKELTPLLFKYFNKPNNRYIAKFSVLKG